MISYTPLWQTMKLKGITSYALTEKNNISKATLTRMRRNGHISTRTLNDLCSILDCSVQDVLVYIPNSNKIES